ncbi:MAG: hypothetical protein K1X68_13965 [Saprospiraceae bacterium]|nr:hypothetical protein [Saprospiraceae bacterium]HNG70189.1 hypothetical protein [Saprospiraceae bacterium]HNL19668.1 hypothetical protein [Saprospiraceae bacterium]
MAQVWKTCASTGPMQRQRRCCVCSVTDCASIKVKPMNRNETEKTKARGMLRFSGKNNCKPELSLGLQKS